MKINFKLSTKEIKIHQAIKIQILLEREDLNYQTKQIFCLAEWTSMKPEDWKRVKQKQVDYLFNKLIEIIEKEEYPEFERFIEIKGQRFGFIPNMDEIEFSEFGDIETIGQPDKDGKGGGFRVLHEILAILYRPIEVEAGERYVLTDYESESSERKKARARLFLEHMTYYQAKSALFFFLPFNRELMRSSGQSLKSQEIQESFQ